MLTPLKRMPAWLSIPATLSLVTAIGYADYLTGDYSILIFYMIPIALAAWSQGNGRSGTTALLSTSESAAALVADTGSTQTSPVIAGSYAMSTEHGFHSYGPASHH